MIKKVKAEFHHSMKDSLSFPCALAKEKFIFVKERQNIPLRGKINQEASTER